MHSRSTAGTNFVLLRGSMMTRARYLYRLSELPRDCEINGIYWAGNDRCARVEIGDWAMQEWAPFGAGGPEGIPQHAYHGIRIVAARGTSVQIWLIAVDDSAPAAEVYLRCQERTSLHCKTFFGNVDYVPHTPSHPTMLIAVPYADSGTHRGPA